MIPRKIKTISPQLRKIEFMIYSIKEKKVEKEIQTLPPNSCIIKLKGNTNKQKDKNKEPNKLSIPRQTTYN
jgi:hypothetical protein